MVWLLDPNKLLPLLVGFLCFIGFSHAARRLRVPGQRRAGWDIALSAMSALVASIGGLLVFREGAGVIAIGGWVLFVVGPNVAGQIATRRASGRDFRTAVAICVGLSVLRPLGHWRELKKLFRAMRWLSEGQRNAGLGLLTQLARSGGELADEARLERLAADHKWDDLYECCQRQRRKGPIPLGWLPRFLRAMGETGRVGELVRTTTIQSGPLFATPPVLPHSLLVTFAFAGRADLVRQVLSESLRYLDKTSQQAWIGTAELAGGDPEAGRARLEACRATADAQQLTAIDRRLASPPPRAGEALGLGGRSQVEALVQRWQQVKRCVPGHGAESLPWATTLIAGLLLVVFGLEEALGGSTNLVTLQLVGALVPERVMAGQWWRVVSALFVHMGPLHLLMNTAGLFALGTFVERRFGAIALTVLFFASGALPMLAHVLLAPLTGATPSVGASGGVMGLAGAMTALLAQGHFDRKLPEARRPLRLLVGLIVLQTGIDLLVPIVDFLGHSMGLATGFTLGALFCGLRWWRTVLVAAPAYAFSLGMQLSLHELPWRTPPCSEGETAMCEQLCSMDFYDACNVMGHKYLRGEDVEEDVARARTFFDSACKAEMGDACTILGKLVYQGEGGPRSRRLGVKLVWEGCRLESEGGCQLLDHLCERKHDRTACELRNR